MSSAATAAPLADSVVRDRLLPDSTVRIDIGRLHAGSGFFAAPGVVVTCDHVLRALELTTNAAPPDVRVVGTDEREYRVLDVSDRSTANDLAVLRVEPAHDHPCALLAVGLRGGDDLVTFGATEKRPGGVPTELRAEGMTNEDPPMMKLSGGQVQPGMSGSPVLSLRTGGVCGVLKRTRDPSQPLGGYAIPIQTLFRLAPSLERGSNRFHEAHPAWFDALPTHQRERMQIGRPSTAAGKPTCFLVLTVKQTQVGWRASAVEYPGGNEIADIDVDLSAVRGNVARVFRYWGRRGRGDPTEETRRLGSILAAVLPDGIGDRFVTLLDDAEGRVELVLRFDDETDPDLVHLPWENLFIARPGMKPDVFVARDDKLAFARTIESELRDPASPTRRALSVLMVEVDPSPESADEDEQPASCVARICDALEKLGQDDRLAVKRVEAPSATQLEDALTAGRYDIVHYVGYGRFVPGDPPVDELALRGTGDAAYVDAAMFAASLAAAPPALVVLQLCEGPEDMDADLSTFAPPLLRRDGTQAVVAYQFPLNGLMSAQFNEVLYRELLAGRSVQMGVQAARRRLWLKNQRSRAFLSPATFLIRPGAFPLTAEAQDSATQTRASALMSYA